VKQNPQARIIIQAPVATVWATLIALDKYHEWNPFVQFEGTPSQGASLPMQVTLFNRTLDVKVLFETVDAQRELRWVGGPKWLMSGSHYFKLASADESGNTTELIQGEEFSGIALPLLWPFLKKELDGLYDNFNRAIKERVEGSRP
jgi:hypothetical protein